MEQSKPERERRTRPRTLGWCVCCSRTRGTRKQNRILSPHYPAKHTGTGHDDDRQLNEPVTKKHTISTTNSTEDLLIACSSMQGWRPSMEDSHVIVSSWEPSLPDHVLVAVFDGHSGDWMARLAAERMVAHIEAQPGFSEYTAMSAVDRQTAGLELLTGALSDAFLALDEALRDEVVQGGSPTSSPASSGCTACVVVLTPTHLVCANAGDSRAVYQAGDKVWRLSTDHKPTLSGERRRIMDAGGEVVKRRVDGRLAVSRSLGDFLYKDSKLAPAKQKVTALPEVSVHLRAPIEVLVVACDGIWWVCVQAYV